MKYKRQTIILPISWFAVAMVSIFLLSLTLRFWNLSQFNTLVFDEVYYAKYANNYLIGKPFFQSHPPLSQYLIAIGIWIGSHFPAAPDTVNNLTGSLRSTFSYRWLNALTGSFFPLLVAAIAYQLTNSRRYTLIATLFVALDGLFLVESRYALNNIYLLTFGLLGQLFFLLYLNHPAKQSWQLILSGIFFGACLSIKWNGLSFLLGIYLFIGIQLLVNYLRKNNTNSTPEKLEENLERKITVSRLPYLLVTLGMLPLVTYSLLWIPHLSMNPEYNFWKVHQEILAFHQKIGGNTPDVHPYCSPWYSWLLMWRPIAYFYEKTNHETTIYDVHAMGNPILWWLSTIAILLIIALLAVRLFLGEIKQYPVNYNSGIAVYLVVNYAANFLPWIKVSRCTFLYHYMGAYVFAILALAWIIDNWLQSYSSVYKNAAKIWIGLTIIAFIYWLPVYLGIPLSSEGFRWRILFSNWV